MVPGQWIFSLDQTCRPPRGILFCEYWRLGMRNGDRDQRATRTRQVWEPRAGRALSDEDIREIEANVAGFFGVLRGWAAREAQDHENGAVGGCPPRRSTRPMATTKSSTSIQHWCRVLCRLTWSQIGNSGCNGPTAPACIRPWSTTSRLIPLYSTRPKATLGRGNTSPTF